MTETTDRADEPDGLPLPDAATPSDTTPADRRPGGTGPPRVGAWAWSFVGVVATIAIVVLALSAVSEIVLPLTLAAVLAVVFKPAVGALRRHKVRPSLAAGLVVLGLLALVTGVVVASVRGIVEQADEIGTLTDAAVETADDELDAVGVDAAAFDDARSAIAAAAPMISVGVLTHLVAGVGTLIGLASGVILGALIMYYLLKDGQRLRHKVVSQFGPAVRDDVDGFIGDACRTLRDYGRGRTDHVRHRVGGHRPRQPPARPPAGVHHRRGQLRRRLHPLHRCLPRRRPRRDRRPRRRGPADAVVMLVVVLAANLLLENFVEPKVMGDTPRHPPAGGARRHRAGRAHRRHRRAHPGRPRLRDRPQRHHPLLVSGPRRAGRRPRRTDRATPLPMTAAEATDAAAGAARSALDDGEAGNHPGRVTTAATPDAILPPCAHGWLSSWCSPSSSSA